MDKYVVDASVIVASLLPDEPYYPAASTLLDKFDAGEVEFISVSLLPFEVANALWKAVTRGRIRPSLVNEALEQFERFGIEYFGVALRTVVELARKYSRTAYDMAYLALALQEHVPLITADKRLYNALEGKTELIRWIGDRG